MALKNMLDKQINRLERLGAKDTLLAIVVAPETFNAMVNSLGVEVRGYDQKYFFYKGYAVYAHHNCTAKGITCPVFDKAKVS